MEAVLGICPYDAEQAAGVEFAQVYRCFVPVQETQASGGWESLLQFRARRRHARRQKGKDDLRGGTRDVHNNAPMQKKCQWEMAHVPGAYE